MPMHARVKTLPTSVLTSAMQPTIIMTTLKARKYELSAKRFNRRLNEDITCVARQHGTGQQSSKSSSVTFVSSPAPFSGSSSSALPLIGRQYVNKCCYITLLFTLNGEKLTTKVNKKTVQKQFQN